MHLKIFCYLTSECKFIREWIMYHGNLFGYQNIHICIRDISSFQDKILKEFRISKGLKIQSVTNTKGPALSEYINSLELKRNILIIILDSNEFIGLHENGKFTTEKEKINAYMEKLIQNTLEENFLGKYTMRCHNKCFIDRLRIKNLVEEVEKFTINNMQSNFNKKLFLSHNFIETDSQGCVGRVHHGNNNLRFIDMCLFVFNTERTNKYTDRAFQDVENLGYDTTNIPQLRALSKKNISGVHKIKKLLYFVDNNTSYAEKNNSNLLIFPDIGHSVRKLKENINLKTYDTPIRIITFIKNEEKIIKEWILYHAYLFGIENLCVMDNNSTDGTRGILKTYESRGLQVIWGEKDFSKRNSYIDEFGKDIPQESFLIRLDANQFLALDENGEIINDKSKIRLHFNLLPKESVPYRFAYQLDCFTERNNIDKPILSIDRFFKKECVHTFHLSGKSSDGKETVTTNLVLFHYSDIGIATVKINLEKYLSGHGISSEVINKDFLNDLELEFVDKINRLRSITENRYPSKNDLSEELKEIKLVKQTVCDIILDQC